MKKRTQIYLRRQKAIRNLFRIDDLNQFLMTSFRASRSIVVKRDILQTLSAINRMPLNLSHAS